MTTIILSLLISFLPLKQNEKNTSIKFNGLYVTKCTYEEDDEEGEQEYLRFYPNGKVISVATDCEGTAVEISKWFYIDNKKIEYLNIGDYKIEGRKITFATTSKVGTVKYSGEITRDGLLKLKFKSLINGEKGREEFNFVEIADLK
jgi:antitoxin component YwqK of YwqJK toxin-antitoxin module